jgi:NAD dependent epimerase/dehydratase family enzyme
MRTVNLRIGSVLCAKEGFIRLFSSMYQRGVSAVFGDGKSWICWIHIEDVVAMCIRVRCSPFCFVA